MNSRKLSLLRLLLPLALVGCQSGFAPEYHNALLDPTPVGDGTAAMMRARPAARADEVQPPASPTPADPAPPADSLDVRAAETASQRLLIYKADYGVAVAHPQAAQEQAAALAEELGGYVHARTMERIVIRVPADRFKTAIERVERLGHLVSRSTQAVDVTEDYFDLKMRLASNQAVLARLKALLEKSDDVKALIEVEREVARVMAEIERLQGLIRLMDNRIALSTITITFSRIVETRHLPAPRRLPIDWLRTLGLGRLLDY